MVFKVTSDEARGGTGQVPVVQGPPQDSRSTTNSLKNHAMVAVGITSKPGRISSTKASPMYGDGGERGRSTRYIQRDHAHRSPRQTSPTRIRRKRASRNSRGRPIADRH